MNKLIALLILVPTAVLAKSPFDGDWKLRPDLEKYAGKPEVFTISNGVYDCTSCAPPYKIAADGTDQAVPGHAYFDHEVVKILSPTAVEFIDKKAGKVMNDRTLMLSKDGAKLTGKFTSYTGEKPFSGGFSEKRVAPAAPGAHAISGSWLQDGLTDLTDAARIVSFQSSPNGIKMIWNGQITDAQFDGKEYATTNDPGKTTVSLHKIANNEFEETDHSQGKIVDIIDWKIAADGKTLTADDFDPIHGTKTMSLYEKQP